MAGENFAVELRTYVIGLVSIRIENLSTIYANNYSSATPKMTMES